MSNKELNELKRKLYQLQGELLELSKGISKTRSNLEKANLENQIHEVSAQIEKLEK